MTTSDLNDVTRLTGGSLSLAIWDSVEKEREKNQLDGHIREKEREKNQFDGERERRGRRRERGREREREREREGERKRERERSMGKREKVKSYRMAGDQVMGRTPDLA